MIVPSVSGAADETPLGVTLVAENFDPGGGVTVYSSTVYTPWGVSGGEAAVCRVDIGMISVAGTNTSPRLRMIVQTKNFDQLDSDLGTGTYTTTGLQTALAVTGVKQLCRIKFILDDSAGSPVARTYCTCFRALPPQWESH